jgi:Na+/H+ antiporter NhaD/arsenite permease-like protein
MKKAIIYVVLVLSICLLSYYHKLSQAQIASLTVFAGLICGTLLFWSFRLMFAFLGMTALIVLGLIDIPHIIEFAGLDVILFLVGMMIVIGYLEERHFFEHLVNSILGLVGNRPRLLMSLLLVLSAFSAALVDEVTSILFMTTTMLHICSQHRLKPIPYIMMLVFATNIGSSATVVGNPIGVIIALRGGLTFGDFIRIATPIALVCLLLTIVLCLWYFRREVSELGQVKEEACDECAPKEECEPKEDVAAVSNGLLVPWFLFIGTIGSLVMHAKIEQWLHLAKNSLLLGTSFAAAGIVLFLERERARELVERRVDWWTLSFFLMLFASVGTLKLVGTTTVIAKGLLNMAGGNPLTIFLGVTWATGALTSVLDNVLAVATFIPVIGDLKTLGIDTIPCWWGMLFGGTLLGNMTIIGSTANIVAIGMLERRGLGTITMKEWILPGALVSLSTGILATAMLWLRFF